MTWRACIGRPLPDAARAYSSPAKWTCWILAPEGHGEEWLRVFRAGPADRHTIWTAIAHRIRRAPVVTVRDRSPHGLVCGVALPLVFKARSGVVMTSWHYREVGAAPRLVTAYPIT